MFCYNFFLNILVFFLFTLLSLSFFRPMVSYLIIYEKAQHTLKYKRRHSEFQGTKATQQLTLSPIDVADSGHFPLHHSSTKTADTDTPSLSLHDVDGRACVFVTRDTVCHPRRFVVGKFVLKLNCSWSEAFVNLYLTVQTDGVGDCGTMVMIGWRYLLRILKPGKPPNKNRLI
jgi:hypothetical protein